MSTLTFVPTTVKLWRFAPSFLTTNGRESEIFVPSTGWMSWKWLSTATTTNGPWRGSGRYTTLSPLALVWPVLVVADEHAASDAATARMPTGKRRAFMGTVRIAAEK